MSHDHNCGPCRPSECDASNEPLASQLDNFVLTFFGTVQKRCRSDGRIEWILPCNLDEGIDGFPRIEGEGLACYFARIFSTAVIDCLPGLFDQPFNGTYTILLNAPSAGQILRSSVQTDEGTLDVAVKINGTPVPGLDAIAASSTISNDLPDANEGFFEIGDTLSLTFANVDSAVALAFNIVVVKNGGLL